ncbi:acyl-CoA dehydrogenase family protein [Leptospira sp. GIMC2001]|uniref:acyl-CoA dehydrogenase family protein n=1 Tax=Leptospira sp. GIMC2001 TaxID=1513297 RepID=UPI00234B5588|nr:acyl-CoA dehydrogenase family protein [Leptospira sp. GIMC2001]WCL48406.1 acyl-CoA dehydrogenase family protein [Leptospira sp. GIMC2001]
MISGNYFSENNDIIDQFESLCDWKEIVSAFEGDFEDAKEYVKTNKDELAMAPDSIESALEYYKSSLESLGELVGKEIAPIVKEMDEIGLKFDNGKVIFPDLMIEAVDKITKAGLLPYAVGRRYGGLGIPGVVQTMMNEIIARADGALGITLGCMNLAETVERFGSKEMVDEYVPKMARGELCGAMALTEPNYGSDLPNLQTKATKDASGKWLLTGTKRFITHGCGFGKVPSIILTLARTGTPTNGARGLSFFLVKSEDVEIASIEKKMGLHCSPTCEVVYENSPGILIGQENYGLVKYSMAMMNTARLSIGAQAMGMAQASYEEAKKYASEREQFGKKIQEIGAVKKMLDNMEREISGMRSALYEAARSIDLYHWREERMKHNGVDEKEIKKDTEIRKWEKLATIFTPVTKYYITEVANKIADDALQIHGGSGYTEDYDVSKLYRDMRITNIYEGTTQLQVVGSIGGIVSGMSQTGILRAYLEDEANKISTTGEWTRNYKLFQEIVESYQGQSDASFKESIAFEVVESFARVWIGLLMERNANRMQGAKREKRKALASAFNHESWAILSSNKIRALAA